MVEIDEKQLFSIIQKAKETGKIRIGANEATKAVERKQAALVVTASDVSPAEIVAHFPGLCNELKIIHTQTGTKAELGALVGIKSTTAIAVQDAGSAKKELETLIKSLESPKKEAPAKKEEVKEETKEEAKAEEAKAEE